MVVYLLLAIIGTAIGASTIDPLKEQDPLEGIATGAAIWTGLSMLIAIAAGGYESGHRSSKVIELGFNPNRLRAVCFF